jgi:hypothetical protein
MQTIRQDDFSAGMVDMDRAGVLPNAVFDAINVIPDGEAALRRRGSTRAYGSDRADATWVWHGMLTGGRRTVVGDNADGLCVLADDSSGLPGSTVASTVVSATGIATPPAHAVLDPVRRAVHALRRIA